MAKAGTKAISATVPEADFNALEEYRWSARKTLSQVVAQAVSEYITAHNIPVVITDDTPAEPETDKVKGK